MSLMNFTGTDIIGTDDMATPASPWSHTGGMSVTLFDAAGGPGNTAAYTAAVASSPGFQAARGNNLAFAAGVYEVFIWARAGTSSSLVSGINFSGWHTSDQEVLVGPGTAEDDGSNRCTVRGLVSEAWSLIKYVDTLTGSPSGVADLLIYPGGLDPNQSTGNSIVLGPCRIALQSESPGWTFDSLRPSLPAFSSITGSYDFNGVEYARNSTPDASLDVARGQSWIFSLVRRGAGAMTVAEKWDDADNYWRVQVTAEGAVEFNCVVGGENIGVKSADTAISLASSKLIAAVITSSGDAAIYVNGVSDVSGGAASTLTTAGTGLSWGARNDGSQPWLGSLGEFESVGAAINDAEALSVMLATESAGLLDPRHLRQGMVDASGNLRQSLVNSRYTSGAGTGKTLKPGLLDSGGELKAGMITAEGILKPGLSI